LKINNLNDNKIIFRNFRDSCFTFEYSKTEGTIVELVIDCLDK